MEEERPDRGKAKGSPGGACFDDLEERGLER